MLRVFDSNKYKWNILFQSSTVASGRVSSGWVKQTSGCSSTFDSIRALYLRLLWNEYLTRSMFKVNKSKVTRASHMLKSLNPLDMGHLIWTIPYVACITWSMTYLFPFRLGFKSNWKTFCSSLDFSCWQFKIILKIVQKKIQSWCTSPWDSVLFLHLFWNLGQGWLIMRPPVVTSSSVRGLSLSETVWLRPFPS